jgi:putative flippase GtrA
MKQGLCRSAYRFGKHQISSLLSTVVDFSVMVAMVSLLGAAPSFGTAVGASAGGATNFMLGRHWTFQARGASPGPQALRYLFVSGASLGWNTLGEWLLCERAGVQYVLARVLVALGVSVLWNFPLQRGFVFRTNARTETAR